MASWGRAGRRTFAFWICAIVWASMPSAPAQAVQFGLNVKAYDEGTLLFTASINIDSENSPYWNGQSVGFEQQGLIIPGDGSGRYDSDTGVTFYSDDGGGGFDLWFYDPSGRINSVSPVFPAMIKFVDYDAGVVAFRAVDLKGVPDWSTPGLTYDVVARGRDLPADFPAPQSAVPEPAAWLSLIVGFAIVGLRQRRDGRQADGRGAAT